nr:hypothetical protein CFP56_54149 [Quercus suber]
MKLCAASVPPVQHRLECVASSATSFAFRGEGDGSGVSGESVAVEVEVDRMVEMQRQIWLPVEPKRSPRCRLI